MRNLQYSLQASRNEFKALDEEIKRKTEDKREDKEIKELLKLLEQSKNKFKDLDNEIQSINKAKENFERNKKNAQESKRALKEKIESSLIKEKELEKDLEKEEERLRRQMEQKKNAIRTEKENAIYRQKMEKNKAIQLIEKEIQNKIAQKKEERKKKVKESYIKLIDDPRDEINLLCETCERNCHSDCSEWGIMFWKPLFACDMIIDGKCIVCYCQKDNHKRNKKWYKTYERERSLSPNSKRKIDDEISKLEKSMNNIRNMDKIQQYDNKI